jgi:hypothetical protein
MTSRIDKMMPDDSRREPIAAETFWDFVEAVNPSLLEFEHVPTLVRVADQVAEGDVDRLMVLMPPRYFKSETFSRLLPAYFLHRHSQKHVGLASYSARLAWKLSGNARDYYEMAGGGTADDTDAKKEWATADGGRMWADGVGGSITGSGFHLGVIDDPMKPQHVRSRAYVEAFRNWYPEVWYNRQEPGARQVVVMQRLGDQDPIDFLFRREVGEDTDEAPEHWHVLCMDEIKSHEPLADYGGAQGLPDTCTLIEDERPEGQILAPSRFDREKVERQQQAAGIHGNPQRQQRPAEPMGEFWKEDWFQVYGTPSGDPLDDLPDDAAFGGKDWDTAYTADESNSASAYVHSFRVPGEDVDVYVTDLGWQWLETPELISWMKQLQGPHHIEAKASGKSAAQFLNRENIAVKEVEVSGAGGDKFARSAQVQPIVSAGRVYVHASVVDDLLTGQDQGLLRITVQDLLDQSGYLDLNDAFVQALNRHTGGSKEAAFGSILSAN